MTTYHYLLYLLNNMVDQQSQRNAPEHRLPTDGSDDHKRHRAYQLVVPLLFL